MFTFRRKKQRELYAPVNGCGIALDDVRDEVFSKRLMGDGCAFLPETTSVCSPRDGELILVADTLHAFGVRSREGIELLIHIGLDTVKLQGKGFQALQSVGTSIKAGTPVISFDSSYLHDATLDMTTMLIVTDCANLKIKEITKGYVNTTDPVIIME